MYIHIYIYLYFIQREEKMSKSVRDDCVRDESELAPICIPICVNNTRRTPRPKISHPTRKNAYVVFRFSRSRAASPPPLLPSPPQPPTPSSNANRRAPSRQSRSYLNRIAFAYIELPMNITICRLLDDIFLLLWYLFIYTTQKACRSQLYDILLKYDWPSFDGGWSDSRNIASYD